MANQKLNVRRVHRFLAPIMVLPLLLTLTTGVLFQFADLAKQEDQYDWLLAIHKGHFGALNLAFIYPFLNGLGLLVLAVTGFSMWFQGRQRTDRAAR
jgi:uncharacterized iron-regulated membrane protein